jgi:hypothetical protein
MCYVCRTRICRLTFYSCLHFFILGTPGAFPAYANPQHSQQPNSPNQPLLQIPPQPFGLAPMQPQQTDAYLVYDDETMSVVCREHIKRRGIKVPLTP